MLNTGQPESMRVCLLGASLDVPNLCVRALARSLLQLVSETHPDARITLMYSNRTDGVREIEVHGRKFEIEIINCRLSHKSRMREHLFCILLLAFIYRLLPVRPLRALILRSNPWLSAIQEAGFIGEICGGDSFSDIYGLRRLILCLLPLLTAILLKKPFVMLPQTYGPFKSPLARRLCR